MQRRTHAGSALPGELLLHPVVIGAVFTLIANDHWLKGALHNALTGKLSDLAGLVFFPLLLVAAWEFLQSRRAEAWAPSPAAALASVAATGFAFTLIQIAPAADFLWSRALGAAQYPLHAFGAWTEGTSLPPLRPVATTMDATDLWCLPVLFVPLWLGLRRSGARPSLRRVPLTAYCATLICLSSCEGGGTEAAYLLNFGTVYTRHTIPVTVDEDGLAYDIAVIPSINGELQEDNCNPHMLDLLVIGNLAQVTPDAASSIRFKMYTQPVYFQGSANYADEIFNIGGALQEVRVLVAPYLTKRQFLCHAKLFVDLESGGPVEGTLTFISGYLGGGRVGPDAVVPGIVVEEI